MFLEDNKAQPDFSFLKLCQNLRYQRALQSEARRNSLGLQPLRCPGVSNKYLNGKRSGTRNGRGEGGLLGMKGSRINVSGDHSILFLPSGIYTRTLTVLRSPAGKDTSTVAASTEI